MGKLLKGLGAGGVAGGKILPGGESVVRHLKEYLIVTQKVMRYQQMLKVVQKLQK